MNCFISEHAVAKAIEFFKNADFSNDDSLPLFLLSKHMGISTTIPVVYGAGMAEAQKRDCLQAIWMMGSLFDSSEMGGVRSLLFPFAFKGIDYYQPGTEFAKAVGRVRDTIKQKNILVPLYNNNDFVLTLRSNYKELVQENYLRGRKIPLSHLAAWLFRFTEFETDHQLTTKEFSRVLEKAIIKFFRIRKQDFLWLFDNDLSINRIDPASKAITGISLRALFAFSSDKMPAITPVAAGTIPQTSCMAKDVVSRYLAMNGDNPDQKDIFSTLMMKKQIVLTGVPGVGKSRYTSLLQKESCFKQTRMVQFHPGYSYDDFIGRETLEPDGRGGTKVVTRKGAFLDFVSVAERDKDNKYLFIIDELNRGNIAEIFGETILMLDRGYSVQLAKPIEGITEISIPQNVYIAATMNTSDRNIAFLDLAIRRRFAFIPLLPNYDFLSEEVSFNTLDMGNVLKTINQRIVDVLQDRELMLGQSYLIPPQNSEGKYNWNTTALKNQFNFVILPTLKEYSFDNTGAVTAIVGEALADGIQDTDEFLEAFNAEFAQ